MAPNTSLGYILLGLSISLLILEPQNRAARMVARLGAAYTFVFALLVGYEYLTHADLGIDTLFFSHRMADWTNAPHPGRYAWPSAISFAFGGGSALVLRTRWNRASEWLAIPVCVVAFLGVLGHSYGVAEFYGYWMSPITAVVFGMVGVSLLLAQSDARISATVLSDRAGGIVSRRIILVALIVLPALGVIRIRAEQHGWVSVELGTALYVVAALITFVALMMFTAQALNRLDEHRERAENALRNSEKLAATGRMAATLAHEVNNPLEAIMNLLYLIRHDASVVGEAQEYARLAEEELVRVSHIAKQTLAFYRDTSAPEPLLISDVVDDVLRIYRARIASRGVVIQREYRASEAVHCGRGELRQVISNVISNALDAVQQSEGIITLTLDQTTENGVRLMRFTCRDNGHGIDPGSRARIFEPFFTTKKDFGTGLGLWVSSQLVKKNGGAIEVSSETSGPERGTTLIISFPAVEVTMEASATVA